MQYTWQLHSGDTIVIAQGDRAGLVGDWVTAKEARITMLEQYVRVK